MSLGTGGHIGGPDELWPELEAPNIARDAPRPATILRVADALEYQGGQVLELFREVESPVGNAVFPIHLTRSGREFFIEVETGLWTPQVIKSVIRRMGVLRASEGGIEKEVLILSSYPVPDEATFFTGTSPGALLQLSLVNTAPEDAKQAAEDFLSAARHYWMDDLDYGTQYLPVMEEFVLVLGETPMLDEVAYSLGTYLGETIRRALSESGTMALWSRENRRSETLLTLEDYELDPVGKARAFIENGDRDSIAFYAGYVLREVSLSE
ncbi:MAG: hypothetical protein ACR2KW_09545 [Rubrobacter sp.]